MKQNNNLSHIDSNGKACMVNVGDKPIQKRVARATGKIILASTTLQLIAENQVKKGEVLTVAQIAGIQAAKATAHLIPLCHPLILNNIELKLQLATDGIIANSAIYCCGVTGVEMEALTAVSVALLTIYDMCKAIDKNMRIIDVYLLEKSKEDVN